ncbi:unnamed protein product [Cylicocyclus nassatus]|uniref:Mitochondrial ornithine transporter 1 n=1 Tax=Cylicocyclus nassatus TaxID=53992 RepID=A0AA36GXG6_CYLNA|nr:unnamed protein product [Cylicocyclus nassatus]
MLTCFLRISFYRPRIQYCATVVAEVHSSERMHGTATTDGVKLTNQLKDGFIDLTAGTFGGIANVYAGQPLDTVKVKVQTFPSLYKNWVVCLKDTYRLDGIRGLYAGTVPALAANIAENAVLFTAYGYCQKIVSIISGHNDVKTMTPLENASAGGLASVFAALVLCPTELVKCRLQAAREVGHACTPFSVCRDMMREKGVRGFFIGMSPTLAREMPGYFCFFGAYEASRYMLAKEGQHKDDIGLMKTAASGAIGGMTLWAAVFPFDSIKSRMQIFNRAGFPDEVAKKMKPSGNTASVAGGGNFVSLMVKVIKTEGIMALYKGLLPTLIRTCLASGCLFVTFENTKKFMHAYL